MKQEESQKIAEEVKIERRGRPKIRVDELKTVGIQQAQSTASPVKTVGEFRTITATPNDEISRKFAHKPLPTYSNWVPITDEEAERAGLAGELIGHDPLKKIALYAKKEA